VPRLLVRTQGLNGLWSTLSTDVRRGVYVEDLQCSADLWGPLDATWTLRRSPRTTWPDLGFWAPTEIEVENQLVWAGRILQTPGTDGDASSIQVQAQGWQSHLDDRPYSQLYVANNASAWSDVRQVAGADLTKFKAAGTVQATNGLPVLAWPAGAAVAGSSADRVGVMFDAGPGQTVKRIVFSALRVGNSSASHTVHCVGADSPANLLAGGLFEDISSFNLSGSTGIFAASFTTPRRYVCLLLQWDGGAGTFTDANYCGVQFTSIQTFASAAYESGNASILQPSTIVADVASRLSQLAGSVIATTSFAIPAFEITQQTPRDAVLAANSYQDWQPRVRADRILEYRAKPTLPVLSLSDQAAFDDLSAGSGDAIYNEATYTGTSPDGTPVLVTLTASGAGLPATIPDRRGGVRGYTIQSGASLTSAAATQLLQVFLSQRNTTPFRGTIHATSARSLAINPAGAPCAPYQLLRYPGELVTFKHLQNPDTGSLGRDGRIAKATYTFSTNSTELDIDSSAQSYESLLARLAVATAR
jgi:hypothetical protein